MRVAVVRALEAARGPERDAAIGRAFEDSSAEVAGAAIGVARRTESIALVPALTRFLASKHAAEPRAEAARALAQLAGPESLRALCAQLTDGEYEVRLAIADALGIAGDASALEPLRSALDHEPDADLQAAYREALAQISERIGR